MDVVDAGLHRLVREALGALGIEKLVLAIHDVSFPSTADEDIGRGSPYSKGAAAFFEFTAELGFDGVQLGPQGQVSPGNLSPYDGSVFSKSIASLPLASFGWDDELVPAAVLEDAVARTPAGNARAHHAHAFDVSARALALAWTSLCKGLERDDPKARALAASTTAFAEHAPWVVHDAQFEAFATLHGTDDFRRWPEDDRAPSEARIASVVAEQRAIVDAWIFGQLLLHRAHEGLRERLAALGLRLYGDLQVGLSLRDRWARPSLFLPRYALGAPPSRTNPEGQPWGYPVLDPRQYLTRFVPPDADSSVLAFVRARVMKLFDEFDGLRIDHPHGLVCPWVYDATGPDAHAAVVAGARLFETPASSVHPALAAFAIARLEQLNPRVSAYDDDRVRDLDGAQIDEYSRLVDLIMESARSRGRAPGDVLCEVLSTCPRPLACVMKKHGLGRFRVTQKASLTDPRDGYRGENAQRADWTMIGNHDTPPLRNVVERWTAAGTLDARAAYLASRLEPDPSMRETIARWLLSHPARLATGMFAELLVGPAANVLVFWADLFGERESYNTPGVVSMDNWSMRVPRSFRETYRARVSSGEALDVPSALALALRARGVAAESPLLQAITSRARWTFA